MEIRETGPSLLDSLCSGIKSSVLCSIESVCHDIRLKATSSINLWCTIGGYCLHCQGTMCWYQFLCLYWQCEFILILYFCFNRSDQSLIVSSMHGPTILESMQLLKWSELVFVRDSQGSLDTVTWFLLIIWGGMDNNFHPSIYLIDDFKILPVFISITYIFHLGQLYIRASCWSSVSTFLQVFVMVSVRIRVRLG